MQIVARRTLVEFWKRHPQAKGPLLAWHGVVAGAAWRAPSDIKAAFGARVDFVADGRAVFDLGGNRYRLIVRVSYPFKAVQIKFVGTHAEYDRIDAATVGAPR